MMRALESRVCTVGLLLWTTFGCGSKSNGTATREDCTRIAEHVAGLIVAEAASKPEELWTAVHASPGDTGIPPEVGQAGFATWLGSPGGQTWMMQRRGQTLAGTQEGVEPCVKKAAPKAWVTCMLASKSKADVQGCDQKVSK